MPAFLAALVGWLGLGLLLLSGACHWFGVPAARVEHGTTVITMVEPVFTVLGKAVCLGTALAAMLARVRHGWIERVTPLLCLLVVLLLFFPYLTMTWTPAIAAQASWLNTQHENLSWLGGDIFNEQEYKDVAWKNQLYVVDTERQVGVFRLPNWSPYMVQWGRLADLSEWLGYSNRFCQFVCKGWFAALAGSILQLTAFCRGPEGLRYRAARSVAVVGLGAGVGATLLALAPPLASGFLMMQARHAAGRGDCATALRWLERSAAVLPAIRTDTYFIAQKGSLDLALHRATHEAELASTVLLEREGFTAQARARYEKLIAETSPGSPIQREAVRAVLRMGINELNSGSTRASIDTLLYVLALEPCNLKALYVLQLAGLRGGRFDLLREAANQMIAEYKCFNTLTKAPVLAACNENLAAAAYLEGHLDQALAFHNAAIGRPEP